MAAMNNFPAMTEEQRQALIKMAKRLSSGVEGNLIANLAKVSLAALTAEPAGKFAFEPLAERYHHIKHGEAQHMEPKLPMVKLFTAPPAPVLCSPDYHDEAKRLAELHGMSFVVFRHGEAPAVADPTRVIIGFTDKGLGHDTTGDQQ